MDDFASRALFNLVASQLRDAGVVASPSSRFEGKIESARKSDLLSAALEQVGAPAIVAIGQGIRAGLLDHTLRVLLSAREPTDLMDRWQRLERYYHGKHRTRILEASPQSFSIEHYSISSQAPSAGEDLLIAGLIAALLQQTGCRLLSLALGASMTAFIEQDHMLERVSAPNDTSIWHFAWQSHLPPERQALPVAESDAVSDQLSRLMREDLGRNWRLATAASGLGLSTRTLQRILKRESATFQGVLRTVRVERSAELLSAGDMTLAEAGFACGFADQAHFSRDFKLRFNMPPSDYAGFAAQS